MRATFCVISIIAWGVTTSALGAASVDSAEMKPASPRVYKDRITPHWLAGIKCFWYCNELPGDSKEFIRVDMERGAREAAFEHAKLATALTKATGNDYEACRLPLDKLVFV